MEEVIDDETEALMCKQQALEGRMPGKTDAELDSETVYRIAWFNHYTAGDGQLLRTENEFLGCELTHFANGFKDSWRKRSHVRVGDPNHHGLPSFRCSFDYLLCFEAQDGRSKFACMRMPILQKAHACMNDP